MLYNLDDLNLINKKIKKGIIVSIVLFAILVGIVTLLAFLTTDENYKVLEVISFFVILLLGFVIIYQLLEVVYKNYNNRYILNYINRSTKKIIEGEVIFISDKAITLVKETKSIVITIKCDKAKHDVYWNVIHGKIPFELNKNYKITTAGNFIIEYEEI